MKKILIGGIVAGIIIFIWQTLSWTVLELHRSSQDYTPKQDSVLAYLSSQFSEDGAYFLPTYPPGATQEQMEAMMTAAMGKPWAQVYYHKALDYDMVSNIIRGLLTNLVFAILFCWMVAKFSNNSFGTTFAASLCMGIIVFSNSVYTQHIWYHSFDLGAHLTDYLVSWGAAGVWLGWWMNRRK